MPSEKKDYKANLQASEGMDRTEERAEPNKKPLSTNLDPRIIARLRGASHDLLRSMASIIEEALDEKLSELEEKYNDDEKYEEPRPPAS